MIPVYLHYSILGLIILYKSKNNKQAATRHVCPCPRFLAALFFYSGVTVSTSLFSIASCWCSC